MGRQEKKSFFEIYNLGNYQWKLSSSWKVGVSSVQKSSKHGLENRMENAFTMVTKFNSTDYKFGLEIERLQ